MKQGKRVFGQSIEEAVELYLDDRKKDVDSGLIVKGRLSAIATQLKHFVEIVGITTKVSELDRGSLFEYSRQRKAIANKKTGKTVTDATVQNEQ